MGELPLLVNVTVALTYALIGGLLARRVGLPTIAGYLLAGVALGPFTPGFQGDSDALRQLAEFGVILLMFGVGLHFSFSDLWQVRRIAIPGALIQLVVIAAAGYGLGKWWGFSAGGAWVLGIALAVSSTVVITRNLMDRGWLDSPEGKIAMGWVVFEDLLTVGILVLLPIVSTRTTGPMPLTIVVAVGKAVAFLGLMYLLGLRAMPALLGRVVNTRSRELFVLLALTVAVGIALVSAAVFNVSIALGAFVAGVVVGESPFSYQIGADLLPFREAFAVIFFVSVGMLVNPSYLIAHWDRVLLVSLVIIVGKAVVAGAIGVLWPVPVRTALVLAAGRSQIGEFSFILGQAGLALGLINPSQYSLILAGAIVSITVNGLLFKLVEPAERALRRRPRVWRLLNLGATAIPAEAATLNDHVVIVGSGRVGRHIAEALGRLQIRRLVIEADPDRVARLRALGVPVLYGDASNSEILLYAGLERARALVITLPDDASALAVAATSRHAAPDLPTIARASSWEGAHRLHEAGVLNVVRPELEGGVEIVRRTLLDLGMPVQDVQRYADLIRSEGLDDEDRVSARRARVLDDLVAAVRGLETVWLDIDPASRAAGQTIGASAIRKRTGASIVAIARGQELIVNPGPDAALHAHDRVAIIGTAEDVRRAERLLGQS